MTFTAIEGRHIEALRGIVTPDRFSTGESVLDLHARDQSRHAACRPEAVIWPETRDEVAAILAYADRHRIPVTGWGSGSSLEGNPIPVCRGVVVDFSRMNRIVAVREEDFQADVEPGVIYQDLNHALRHRGLFFPPDPGARATIGGIVANNASGTRTVHYGSARDYVQRLVVALAGGEIIEIGTRAAKTSSGYDMVNLFVGAEGTLGLVVEATLRLVGLPETLSAAVVTFPAVTAAAGAVYEIIRGGLDPAALELLDTECIDVINREKGLGLASAPTLFFEFHGASETQLAETLSMAEEICRDQGGTDFRFGLGRDDWQRLFGARHEMGEMIVRSHPGCGIYVIDVAVPMTGYPDLIAAAKAELAQTGLTGYVFSHAGDGNLHLNLVGPNGDERAWKQIAGVSERLVGRALAAGGTATGEHGVGIGKRGFMEAEHGRSLRWMRRIKDLFDPNGILNPGKIFPE